MALNKKEIEDLLNKEEIVFIATSRADATPHIVPIWFVYHKGKIYFETDITTVKFQNIKRNKKVALCFGGKDTYIVEGTVRWWKEEEAPLPFRKMLWSKYKEAMDDSFINEKTRIFEVTPEKEMSWHYAPSWD